MQGEGAILSVQPSRNDSPRSRKAFLPIGELSVVDPNAMNGLMEDVLSGEEMVEIHLEKPAKTAAPEMNNSHQRRGLRKFRTLACMYCKGDHKPAECGKYKTPQERAQYLRERNLCQTATRVNIVADDRTSQVHHEDEEQRMQCEGAILSVQPSRNDSPRSRKAFLPIGELSIVDPDAMNLRKIQVLIDTGAEMSFIETNLANKLSLSTTEERLLSYHTFGSEKVQKMQSRRVQLPAWDNDGQLSYHTSGSEKVQKMQSRRVQLPAWDNDGQLHMLDLLTSDIFMKDFAVPPLSEEDEEALRSLNLQPPLKMVRNQQAKPSILLGSDQAWQFFKANCSHAQLPSGLHVLPTTMGNILAGQLKEKQKILHLRLNSEPEELTQWDKYWSLEPQVNMVQEDFNLSLIEFATLCVPDFRLDPRDVEGGPKYLSRMILELKPTSQRLEGDLTAVLNEIKVQVNITTSLRNEWFRLLCSTTLHEMGTAERPQLLNQHLLTANLTKERLLRLGTRICSTDRIYGEQCQRSGVGGQERRVVTDRKSYQGRDGAHRARCTTLGTTIKEITRVHGVKDGAKKSDESVKASRPDKPQPSQETDDQYFDRLLRESSGDQVEETQKNEGKEDGNSHRTDAPEKPCSSKTCSRKRALTTKNPLLH
ncbi:Tas retrotransposon peptidase A16 [Ostertagia ostertagi]